MYAIIETGGKQYKVEKGNVIKIEKLDVDAGTEVTFPVLMMANGKTVRMGNPELKDVVVKGKVISHDKEKKIVVFKYKPKKKYRVKQGHRQPYSKVEITAIGGDKDDAEVKDEKATAKAKAADAEVKDEKATAKAKAADAEVKDGKAAAKAKAADAEVKDEKATTKAKAADEKTEKKPAAKKPAAKATAEKAEKKPAAKAADEKTEKKPAAKKPAAKATAEKAEKKPAAKTAKKADTEKKDAE